MIFNIYFFFLLLISNSMFLLSLLMIYLKKIFIIKWLFFSLMNWNIEFLIFIDWMSLSFLSIVTFISAMVMLYSKEYMIMELKKKYFIMILMMFVISMILLIISPNIFSLIIGWDGLGLISYCLIIYYQNKISLNSGMITLMSNRIGDIMLLIMIFLMMNLNSWNLLNNYKLNNFLFISLFLIMIMTKSAQIPFSMWLPAAMAAPTPVSSLVHSSTLVTAGIYLLIRFNKLFIMNKFNFIIMFIGLMTMFTSSINAMFEFDLKKIIAFSTLSQLGLMMMMLSKSLPSFVFFHLISHAMFKSLLFLCSGMMIHSMMNFQDIRFMGNLIYETPLTITYFNTANLSLCGIPFLSGFFSKDMLYELILNWNINMMIFILMFFCISLTLMYSIRLMFYLSINMNMYSSIQMKNDNYLMTSSTLMLFFMSILFGSMMNWILFSSLNLSIINMNFKNIIYMMMMISLINILMIKLINYNKLMINKLLIKKLNNFMFLLKISLSFNSIVMKFSKKLLNFNELYWNEFYSKFLFKIMFNKIYLSLSLMHFNFLSMFISLFMFTIMLMYFMN
uniref:NADH-ubiquinone oxidoreductase chain 5 n=1 Tax=Ganaspini sp. ZJUH 20220007 TaxID=2943474 RepID=A0A9E8G8Z4_9HYME|nr:NADH dehydrogenase subunit 5 [Ganaspini sp. ZJUH 20220007]